MLAMELTGRTALLEADQSGSLEAVGVGSLTATIRCEHPGLAEPVVQDGVTSWRLPTGWSFMAREEGSTVLIGVCKTSRPFAWIPVTETEALGCLGWFLKRKT